MDVSNVDCSWWFWHYWWSSTVFQSKCIFPQLWNKGNFIINVTVLGGQRYRSCLESNSLFVVNYLLTFVILASITVTVSSKLWCCCYTTTTIFWLSGLCLGQPRWASTRRYISPSSGFSGAKWKHRQMHQQSRWTATRSRLISAPTSTIPTILMPDALPDNRPNLSWLGTGTKYAGLNTHWLG